MLNAVLKPAQSLLAAASDERRLSEFRRDLITSDRTDRER
jgi:hypothetical protein